MKFEIARELALKKIASINSNVPLSLVRKYYQKGTVVLIFLLLFMSMLNLLNSAQSSELLSQETISDLGHNFSLQFEKLELPPAKPDTGLPIDVGKTSNENKMIYNRIDKCGTRTFLYIVNKLSLRNEFHHFSSDVWAMKYSGTEQQKSLITQVNTMDSPLLYDRPVHYVHFPRYGARQPSWISLVRDPLERFIALFYYKRYGDQLTRPATFTNASHSIAKQTFDDCVLNSYRECTNKNVMQIIPYFCGQGVGCRIPNRWALETAKRNAVDNFAVVGILEDLNSTLFVLENVFPQFFKGGRDAYSSLLLSGEIPHYSSFAGDIPSSEARAKMKERLALEYEFYDFIRDRLMLIKKQFTDDATEYDISNDQRNADIQSDPSDNMGEEVKTPEEEGQPVDAGQDQPVATAAGIEKAEEGHDDTEEGPDEAEEGPEMPGEEGGEDPEGPEITEAGADELGEETDESRDAVVVVDDDNDDNDDDKDNNNDEGGGDDGGDGGDGDLADENNEMDENNATDENTVTGGDNDNDNLNQPEEER
ncbi:uncharacterized protein [Ptychodera flava]|uniref:uncharacterized protein n=1 Tax=Ptychodera flava TaxID=63121 RepID=UPI00396A906E